MTHPSSEAGAPAAETLPAAPDWAAIRERVACPLCDYDLRGLVEPRCPECGYRFEWPELLEADRSRHPYLFEDQDRRLVRSFFATVVGGLRPRRFWSSLKPTVPPKPRRLKLYWALTTGLVVTCWCLLAGWKLMQADLQAQDLRAQYTRSWGFPAGNPAAVAAVQTAANQLYPPMLNPAGVATVLGGRWGQILSTLGALFVAWPVLTFATLMIFRASMRRAKVRTVHVLRCAVYSSDFGFWLLPLLSLVLPEDGMGNPMTVINPYVGAVMIAAFAVALLTFYRLAAAYDLYLKFDHPRATAAASQVIPLLLTLIVVWNHDLLWR